MMAFWNRWIGKSRDRQAADCAVVKDKLYEYLDQEIDNAELVEMIREHLKDCKRCFPKYQFEQAFLTFIAELGRTNAPPQLRRRIFDRILEEESRSE